MITFSETFRAILWLSLCVAMALGIVLFALFYGAMNILFKNFAWRDFSSPSFSLRLPRIRAAFS